MPDDVVTRIVAGLLAASDPNRAVSERAYLKSDLEHLGASVPAIRSVVRSELKAYGPLAHDEAVAAARRLWVEPVHERRAAAVELLERSRRVLGSADAPFLEELLRESRTWALVDPIATAFVGPLVVDRPADWEPILVGWSADSDFWVRRASLLAYLPSLRAGGPFDAFAVKADAMLDEREFFIRKAIGWVLRETGKKRPDLVAAWVLPRARRASCVTLREALKPLSPEQREAVSRAAGRGRPR
jgi:3-methyladenine DNA glycosylase AlkD